MSPGETKRKSSPEGPKAPGNATEGQTRRGKPRHGWDRKRKEGKRRRLQGLSKNGCGEGERGVGRFPQCPGKREQ